MIFPIFSSIKGTVFQNQIIYQTCTDIFKFNKTECVKLGTQNATNETEIIEKLVQPYAAKFFMARTIVESLLPALASLFIGPWSDKFGRKPVIVSTFVGEYFISFTECKKQDIQVLCMHRLLHNLFINNCDIIPVHCDDCESMVLFTTIHTDFYMRRQLCFNNWCL